MTASSTTRARWAIEFEAVARAYWTPERTESLAHGKRLTILPGDAAVLLRALGLLNGDGTMPPAQRRKYFQINHMIAVLRPAILELRGRFPRVRLLDAGCGRSYLTLLLAWCGKHLWGHPIEVLGVDRNPDVIAECRRRTALAELDDVVRFDARPLDQLALPVEDAIHGIFALHACDTATCDALALGVAVRADLIAVAPCCQAELARGWAELDAAGAAGDFAALWRIPHLRRETAAHVTDLMRTLLVRAAGFDVAALEFVPAEHTRKNTLLRARRGGGDVRAWDEYEALKRATGGIGLALERRLGVIGPIP